MFSNRCGVGRTVFILDIRKNGDKWFKYGEKNLKVVYVTKVKKMAKKSIHLILIPK